MEDMRREWKERERQGLREQRDVARRERERVGGGTQDAAGEEGVGGGPSEGMEEDGAGRIPMPMTTRVCMLLIVTIANASS